MVRAHAVLVAQGHEARMQLAGRRAGHPAGVRIGGPQPGLRIALGGPVADGQGVPDGLPLDVQHRHLPAGRDLGQFGVAGRAVQVHHPLGEGRAAPAQHQPRTQRPGGIALGTDDLLHGCLLRLGAPMVGAVSTPAQARALTSAARGWKRSAMISRYARPEAVAIWSAETKYSIWFEIEAHAATKMAE